MRRWVRWILIASVLTAATGTYLPPAQAVDQVSALANGDYPNCRLGIGVLYNPLTTYSYDMMRLGWYVNWRADMSPVKPWGVDYYFTVRIWQDIVNGAYANTYQISPQLGWGAGELGPIVQANPGGVWLLGNEIDRITQNAIMPDLYAQAYHETYTFIKGIDPTAQIAIGSIVEPTPLRFQYLDMILATYSARFREPMPIDVWNIHMYILPELKGSWGAEIPPGVNVITGTLYTPQDHADINVFKSLILNMRTWMKNRGYQNKPLIITEFGALLPLWLGYITEPQLQQFTKATITYLNTAADVNLGYPVDGYRLVQQAALYSLDDDSVDSEGFLKWGTFLFNSASPYTMTATGSYYRDQIAAKELPSVDLFPYRALTRPGVLIVSPTQTISPTFTVLVANGGNTLPTNSSGLPVSPTIRFQDVTGGGNVVVGQVTLPPFTGCGTQRLASIVWPNLSPGVHIMQIEVDPDNLIVESQKSNNVTTFTVLVGTYGIYLPVVVR